MITIKLDVTKLEKGHFHHGKKGIYTDLVLFEHPNDYGDDGYVVQSVSKEKREAGEKGPIVGNWRETNKKTAPPPRQAPATLPEPPASPKRELPEDDDLPF